MKKERALYFAVGLGLLMAAEAQAIDFTPTGAVLSVTYKEPAVNKDGSALDDLDHTNVYFQVGTNPEVKGANIAATKAAGGGTITTSVTVPIPADAQANVTVSASATDSSGNESLRSTSVTKRIDRLAPAAPQ